jgi:putative two-component system response regulator
MEDNSRRILVIDDEEPIRKVLSTHLSKEGYEVIQSPGGRKVFELIDGSAFEVMICDIKMPEVDGVEVLEYAQKNSELTPVIMLTGLTDAAVAVDVMKRGAFDYVMKPVKKEDLIATIDRAYEHRRLVERNRQLECENKEYQLSLEKRVDERTRELGSKTVELEKAYDMLKSMNIQFVNVLAETIEAKDRYTRGHCNRMRYLCVELGRLTGLTHKELDVLEYASLLHDLGKIGVNEVILNKEGPLTEAECARIKEHPRIGERILKDIPLMEPVSRIIVAHHENFDGSGYPKGLKGPDIPLQARIISVADLYDAMTSDRPYRKGLPMDLVIDEMSRVSGCQLDPDIVKIFLENKVYLFIKN